MFGKKRKQKNLKNLHSESLHFKPVEITVAIQPAKGEYGESNQVKGYKAVGAAGPATMQTAPATASTPWGKKAA